MKKTVLLTGAVFVVAGVVAVAQAPAPATAAKAPAHAKAAAVQTHVFEAEVVSADAAAKTLTVKTEKAESTLKVEEPAAKHLMHLKAGEKVKLTCRDNAKGEHEAITHIAVETAPVAKTHVFEAEVVSADAAAKTLTVKTDKAESTLKVDESAAKHLMHLKAGEKVKLTCRDNAKGEHEVITHIAMETAPAPAKK